MPVKIELFTNYPLRRKRNDPQALDLPVIELAPTSRKNPAYISSVSISVRGNPTGLANMIQFAYKEVKATKPIKLETPQRVRQYDCRLDEPSIPADVNCILEVKVEYFDSDSEGNPDMSVVKETRSTCHIRTSFASESEQELEESEESVESENVGEVEPIEAETKEKNSQEEKILPSFPGWFAIDFGTSNSTVTLYDPKFTVPPDSLPREQEKSLRTGLARWLNDRPTEEIPRVTASDWDSEWEKLTAELSKEFAGLDPGEHGNLGDRIFEKTDNTGLLSGIRLVEISLSSRRDWFRRSASKRLHEIYHEVFRKPTLEWQSLIPVELDELRRESEITSELEIEEIGSSADGRLKVLMGDRARQDRLNAIAQGQDIQGKFHHSPKRYLGQNRSIPAIVNGSSEQVAVQKLIQAAFSHLIQLTQDYRDRNQEQCSVGQFNRAVVTYPTISPPKVHQEVKELVKKLGISDVQMAYDEAVSIAIFFLWREFGGDLNVGIESFKTRCRSYLDQWSQNVLVLDIGGGTTDLALIRLTLKEVDPFESDEDRGDGGRYYIITPKLLGSSGHLQLGGELISLRIFLLLKAAIADCLLTAVAAGNLEPDILGMQPDELNERFLDNGKFQAGKLLASVDKENPEGDVAYKDALEAAEKVLSTRWKNSPARQQAFYTLWEHAEEAKLKLGKKYQTKEGTEPTFVLDGQKISELLAQNDIQLPQSSLNHLSVTLSVAQFERTVKPAIKEAIGIAKGLMESGLSRQEASHENELKEQLDWLILSGKTCNLYLVEQELYRQFSKSDRFVWNPEKITFVPEYTKLATSAGACYAEKLRQLVFAPEDAKEVLRKGANQLYIDVKNLFYFLPCSFLLKTQDIQSIPIFKAGDQLYQLDPKDKVAKVRSEQWYGAQLSIFIERKDFEDKTPQLWGSYDSQQKLATPLGMTGIQFNETIKVQFEIDQELNISLLFCQGKPHYLMQTKIPSLDATEAIKRPAIISEGKVVCDIAVNVAESASALKTDAHTVVFAAEKDYSKSLKNLRYEGEATPEVGSGLISEPLPPFPLSGKHTFYFQFRDPDTNKWERIGELPQPGGKTEYPCEYRVTLDDKGILRIHAGEIPYWTGNNKECLKESGCVFRTAIESQPNDIEEKRNPFSGTH